MTPATSFVSKPTSLPTPWSSWTMKSPLRRSANDASARPSRRSARGGRLRKTCVSGSSTSPSSRQTKPRRAGATAKRSSGCSGSSWPASRTRESARLSRLSVRSASPACGNATTTRLPPRTKPFSSFSASASPRAAIAGRWASKEKACDCGNGSSSDVPFSEISSRPSSDPDAAHLVGLPDEVRHAFEHRYEVVRDLRRRSHRPFVVGERRLAQIGLALGRRVDDGVVDRVQRPLGERREGAHLLDLVAVELDAERLAARRREHVDEAAANGELAALLGALDPLVAGERQRLRQTVEAGLGAHFEPHRLSASQQAAAFPRQAPSPRRRRGRPRRAPRAHGRARRRGAVAARGRSPSARRGPAAARPGRRR